MNTKASVIVTPSERKTVDFVAQSLGLRVFNPSRESGGLIVLGAELGKLGAGDTLVVPSDPSGAALMTQVAQKFPEIDFHIMPSQPLTRGLNKETRLYSTEIPDYPELGDKGIVMSSIALKEMEFLANATGFPFFDCKVASGAILLYPELVKIANEGGKLVLFADDNTQNQIKSAVKQAFSSIEVTAMDVIIQRNNDFDELDPRLDFFVKEPRSRRRTQFDNVTFNYPNGETDAVSYGDSYSSRELDAVGFQEETDADRLLDGLSINEIFG